MSSGSTLHSWPGESKHLGQAGRQGLSPRSRLAAACPAQEPLGVSSILQASVLQQEPPQTPHYLPALRPPCWCRAPKLGLGLTSASGEARLEGEPGGHPKMRMQGPLASGLGLSEDLPWGGVCPASSL